MVQVPSSQCPSSAPVPRAALGGPALPGRGAAHRAPSHGLGCSSEPPPKPPMSPPLTLQVTCSRRTVSLSPTKPNPHPTLTQTSTLIIP
eukprot:scaffold31473_cov49-Phaeocystis_antarctica.AAC.2